MEFMFFSKHLQKLPLAEQARGLKAAGYSFFDLPVRRGGQVDPERVEEDLPKALEVIRGEGMGIGMISTDLTDATAPVARKVLETAKRLGIAYYKLGYYKYAGFGTLRKARDEVKAMVRGMAQLSADVGIHGGFHNHSGMMIGASCWDVDYLLAGTDPKWIGSYYDPVHALVEGGNRGWLMSTDLLADRITMLGAKDFRWIDSLDHYPATRRNGWILCSFQEGTVPWPEVMSCLKRIRFDGPVSIHSGYPDPAKQKPLDPPTALKQAEADLKQFQAWWQAAQ
jgi:L-ribulose-5-phosphate 3-epimerase